MQAIQLLKSVNFHKTNLIVACCERHRSRHLPHHYFSSSSIKRLLTVNQLTVDRRLWLLSFLPSPSSLFRATNALGSDDVMLSHVMLCYVMPCYAMLSDALLYYIMLRYAMLCSGMLVICHPVVIVFAADVEIAKTAGRTNKWIEYTKQHDKKCAKTIKTTVNGASDTGNK